MGYSTTNNAQNDQDARVRNAAAQARHRQKRKAYVTHLEQTLAQLQLALSTTSNTDVRIQQLQEENARLNAELQLLKSQFSASNSNSSDESSPIPSTAQLSGQFGGWMSAQTGLQAQNQFSRPPSPPWTDDVNYGFQITPPVASSSSGYNSMGQRRPLHHGDPSFLNNVATQGYFNVHAQPQGLFQPQYGSPNPYAQDDSTSDYGLQGWNPQQ